MGKHIKGPRLLISKLKDIQRKVVRETAGETGRVVRSIDAQVRKRVWPSRNISKQDDPGGIARRQSSSKNSAYSVDWSARSDGIVIKVKVQGHATAARTPAIIAAFARLGRANDLRRTSLLVRKGKARKIRNGPTVRLSFASNPLLKVWAERQNKGEQIRRHVVQLDKVILQAVIMDPSLEKSRKAVLAAWKRGVESGFLG